MVGFLVFMPITTIGIIVTANILVYLYHKFIKSNLYINHKFAKLGIDRTAPDLIFQDIHYFFEQQVIFNTEKNKIAKFNKDTMMPIGCDADDFIGIYLYMSIEHRKKIKALYDKYCNETLFEKYFFTESAANDNRNKS